MSWYKSGFNIGLLALILLLPLVLLGCTENASEGAQATPMPAPVSIDEMKAVYAQLSKGFTLKKNADDDPAHYARNKKAILKTIAQLANVQTGGSDPKVQEFHAKLLATLQQYPVLVSKLDKERQAWLNIDHRTLPLKKKLANSGSLTAEQIKSINAQISGLCEALQDKTDDMNLIHQQLHDLERQIDDFHDLYGIPRPK